MDSPSDLLIRELRRGEREAFVRYYEQYHAPVYNLARRLLHDGEDAVTATAEVFTTAYRRILLHDDGTALREQTYRAALGVCRERSGEPVADQGAAESAATGAGRQERGDLGRRFAQALEMLPFDYQAVLLLHDINRLRSADLGTVFGVTEDAASALLLRAREEFRRGFAESSSGRRAAGCRLAEQTAVGAVGWSLSDDEARRLEEHAGYCRHCRRTMKGWGAGAIGLALFLEDAPLPQALETTPVFGTKTALAGAAGAAAGAGLLTRMFAQTGRSLASRTAAYTLAAACLALAVGLAVQHSPGDQTSIAVAAVGPNVSRSLPLATTAVRPTVSSHHRTPAAGVVTPVTTSARSATASPPPTAPRAAATEPIVSRDGDDEHHLDSEHPKGDDEEGDDEKHH